MPLPPSSAALGLPLTRAVASVVQPFGGHTWWNTIHGALLGGLFLVSVLATLLLVLQLRPGDLTDAGVRQSLGWARVATGAMVTIGWAVVITGSFAVDHWFLSPAASSPANLLRARGDGAWVTAEHVKEWAAWISVLAATAAAVFVFRGGPQLLRRGRPRMFATASLSVSLALAALAGGLGVLLTKLAPLL
jgi:hypothetical protein